MNTKPEHHTPDDEPTVEEMFALIRGELSGEQEQRVRAYLVEHPEMARALTDPFPEDEVEAAHPHHVSQEELDRRWSAMRSDLGIREREAAQVVPLRRFQGFMAAAAMVIVVLGAISLQQHRRVRSLIEPEMLQPIHLQSTEGRRGPAVEGSQALPAGQKGYVLEVPVHDGRFDEYRLSIIEAQSGERRWISEPMPLDENGALSIQLRRGFLEPGRYRIVVTGSGSEEEVKTYAIVIPSHHSRSERVQLR